LGAAGSDKGRRLNGLMALQTRFSLFGQEGERRAKAEINRRGHQVDHAVAGRAAARKAARRVGARSGDIFTSSQRLNRDMLYVKIQ